MPLWCGLYSEAKPCKTEAKCEANAAVIQVLFWACPPQGLRLQASAKASKVCFSLGNDEVRRNRT